jgi:quercetin dioxygenase-like cupin family protein
MFRIVIAGTDEVRNRRLSACLGRTPGLAVVGAATDLESTLELALRTHPDVVVLELDGAGRYLVEPLRRLVPGVLVVAVVDDPHGAVASGPEARDVVALLVPDHDSTAGVRVVPTYQ